MVGFRFSLDTFMYMINEHYLLTNHAKLAADYKTKGDEAHEDGKHAAAAIDLEDSINDVTLMEHNTLTNLDRKFDFGTNLL